MIDAQMETAQTRRQFLLSAVRYLTLGALGLMGGLLWACGNSSAKTCINLEICNGCPAFRGCGLPPALSQKGRTEGEADAG